MIEDDPSIGAIVCECTNITPYSHEINRAPRRAGVRHGHAGALVSSRAAAAAFSAGLIASGIGLIGGCARRRPTASSGTFERLRRQLRGGEAAEAALAAAHAAAGDRLEAIDLGRAEVRADRGAQLAGRDALAAANHHAVIEVVE